MQQYTLDLSNREEVHVDVLTVRTTPRDRFAPQVNVQPIANVQGTGLSPSNFNFIQLVKFFRAILQTQPDVVHFTGPHIWNPILLAWLKRTGIPTIHTLHDLDPHSGSGYGRSLYVWNDSIKRLAGHILVHSQAYQARLGAEGVPANRVTYTPLLHLFMSDEVEKALRRQPLGQSSVTADHVPFALFFARLEEYKGVNVLIDAMREIEGGPALRAIIAGKGDTGRLTTSALPTNVEIRNRFITDPEAIDLFSRCSVVVLPYLDATQSALIAAAYFFAKPVIVSRSGALPEYVSDGETGWIVEPRDARTLADRLRTAANDPARLAQMGQMGRDWYVEQRLIERHTLQMMYDNVGRKRTMPNVQVGCTPGGWHVNDR